MLTPPQDEPRWVSTPHDLQRMAQALQGLTMLAVDTESNGLHAYREQVCLIQFSTGNLDYLVDTLALDDLSPLTPIFSNPAIEKIFHAADYDLGCLKRDYGFDFCNIFDTMLAGRILGRTSLGLDSLLQDEFQIHLDKRYQRANWGRRPLPKDQLNYARLDSYYLIPLRNRLQEQLAARGLEALAQEDFQRLCNIESHPTPENGAQQIWRIAGRQELTPRQAAVLYQLSQYREEQARLMDRPTFKVISNQSLVHLAIACPSTLDELENVYGMTPYMIRRHGRGLLQAVTQGLQSPPLVRPCCQRPDHQYLKRLEILHHWRKKTGHEQQVSSDVILPRDVMEEIARRAPQNLEQLSAIMGDLPWRLQRYGEQILAALRQTS